MIANLIGTMKKHPQVFFKMAFLEILENDFLYTYKPIEKRPWHSSSPVKFEKHFSTI